MADHFSGTYEFPKSMTHTDRASTITALKLQFDAIQAMGWQEHTSDWDWRISITLAPSPDYPDYPQGRIIGTRYADYDPTDQAKLDPQYPDESWADDFKLDLPPNSDTNRTDNTQLFTACVEADANLLQTITVDELDNDGNSHPITILINDIRSIEIGEA